MTMTKNNELNNFKIDLCDWLIGINCSEAACHHIHQQVDQYFAELYDHNKAAGLVTYLEAQEGTGAIDYLIEDFGMWVNDTKVQPAPKKKVIEDDTLNAAVGDLDNDDFNALRDSYYKASDGMLALMDAMDTAAKATSLAAAGANNFNCGRAIGLMVAMNAQYAIVKAAVEKFDECDFGRVL